MSVVAEIKETAIEKFGVLPIISVKESIRFYVADPEIDGDEDVTKTEDFLIDLELLTEDDDSSISYVKSIIIGAIEGDKIAGASTKTSFSDTPDWWVHLKPVSSESRKIIEIEVLDWDSMF